MADAITIAGLAAELGTTRRIVEYVIDAEKIKPTELNATTHLLSKDQQRQIAKAIISKRADAVSLVKRCEEFLR